MHRQLDVFGAVCDELGLVKGMSFLVGSVLKSNKEINLPGLRQPVYLRPGTSDQRVFVQVFVRKEYDHPLDFEPKIIIDGGANIGLASVYFKSKYPDAKIIAIEPDAENAEMVRKNTAAYDDVHVKQAGIWSKKTKTALVDKYDSGKWGLVVEEITEANDKPGINAVDAVTIQDIMDEYGLDHIDLLKLDIETSEKQVFSENYMSWLPKVKVLIVELHDAIADGCSKPFFTAINQAFTNYSFFQEGENTIIINKDLV